MENIQDAFLGSLFWDCIMIAILSSSTDSSTKRFTGICRR